MISLICGQASEHILFQPPPFCIDFQTISISFCASKLLPINCVLMLGSGWSLCGGMVFPHQLCKLKQGLSCVHCCHCCFGLKLWLRSAHATQVHQEAEAPVWLPSLAVLFSSCYLIGWFQRASALWCAFLVLLPVPEKVSCHLLDTFRQLLQNVCKTMKLYTVFENTQDKKIKTCKSKIL